MEKKKFKLTGHKNAVLYASYSSDGSRILSISKDNTIRVWDSNGTLKMELIGHSNTIKEAKFIDKSGLYIVSASMDKTVRIWSTSSGNYVSLFPTKSSAYTVDLWSETSTYITGDSSGNLYYLKWEQPDI